MKWLPHKCMYLSNLLGPLTGLQAGRFLKLIEPCGSLKILNASILSFHHYRPTPNPTRVPTNRPTKVPTKRPTRKPSARPTKKPSKWGGWNDDGHDDTVEVKTDTPTAFPTYHATEESGSQFRAGYKKGEEVAEQIWEDNGSDCGYIFSFEDDVENDVSENCSANSSFCRGVRAGATSVVRYYEKQCLQETPDECVDLGEAAAQEIAFDFCPFDASASFAPPSPPDYKETCREVATGICKGALKDQVSDNGCSISNNDLKDLQDKCEHQVDMMTGGGDDEIVEIIDDDDWHGSGDDGYEYVVRTDTPTVVPTTSPTYVRAQ